MSDHVNTVKQLYADFGAGNIDGILSNLSADIEWSEPPGGVAPFAGVRRGHAAMADFFRALGERCEVEAFEPREFVPHGDKVIVLGHYRFKARPTGKSWDTDWIMVWTFTGEKVSRFQNYKDTGAEVAAFQA